MARQKAQVEYSNFTKGFITEASPLTYPEDASIDEQNININRDGSRQRRFGLDWSPSASPVQYTNRLVDTNLATSSYLWKGAGKDGTKNIGVLQRGNVLHFYNVDAEDPSSAHITQFTMLSTYMPDTTFRVSMTSAYGKLLIAAGSKYVISLTWNGASVSPSYYTLKVRDRWGIDDGLAVDAHPTGLTTNHNYNLRNQGWPWSMKCSGDSVGATTAITADPVDYTFTASDATSGTPFSPAAYPSNADLVWASKITQVAGTGGAAISNIGTFSPWELAKQIFGTTPAPRGKYIIDVFDRSVSRTTESTVTSIRSDSTQGHVSEVASFAGRLWYAITETGTSGGDANTPNLGNMVLYSQAKDDEEAWGSCHTFNDPTSEDYNDVLENDGGYISIPDAGEIYKMLPLGEALYIFASNGVWEVFGGDTGFSSTTQSVVKVSDIGPISERPVILGDTGIVYWAESGIYTITLDQASLRGIATNLSEDSIQSFYDDIPIDLKKQAVGSYDPIARQAVWLYNDVAKESEYLFDRELVLDVNKVTFTKRKIDTVSKTQGAVYPTCHFRLRNLVQGVSEEDVTDGGVTVTDGSIPVTLVVSTAEQKTKSSLMYWICNYGASDDDYYIGAYQNFNFYDYPQVEDTLGVKGVDNEAFLVTGYLTGGDSSRVKWFPYISTKMKRTESGFDILPNGDVVMYGESSCIMQTQWEWTNDGDGGKWGRPQQVYRLPRFQFFDDDELLAYDVVNTRNKVRGSGRALSIKYSSEPGKDLYMLGWGIEVSIKQSV